MIYIIFITFLFHWGASSYMCHVIIFLSNLRKRGNDRHILIQVRKVKIQKIIIEKKRYI